MDRETSEDVPVLIVGGSLVGLSAALFLRWHGVDVLAVERHAGTAIKARAWGATACCRTALPSTSFRALADLGPLLADRNQGVHYVTNPLMRGFFRLDL